MERVQDENVQHVKSVTRQKYNLKIVQHQKSIVTEENLEKSAKGECTIVHKRITGLSLTNRYTLVKVTAFSISARPFLLRICKNIYIALSSFLPSDIVSSPQHDFRHCWCMGVSFSLFEVSFHK